jgi:hypothetical protein
MINIMSFFLGEGLIGYVLMSIYFFYIEISLNILGMYTTFDVYSLLHIFILVL